MTWYNYAITQVRLFIFIYYLLNPIHNPSPNPSQIHSKWTSYQLYRAAAPPPALCASAARAGDSGLEGTKGVPMNGGRK